jgi:hypothetical protein
MEGAVKDVAANSMRRAILSCALSGGAALILGVLLERPSVAQVGLWLLLLTPVVRNLTLAAIDKRAVPRLLALLVAAALIAIGVLAHVRAP